jgi:phosphonate transport system permease protein
MNEKNLPPRSPIVAGVLSALIPGLGHFYTRQRYRGIAVFLSMLVVTGMVIGYGQKTWYLVPVAIWLWNIWDAVSLTRGKARSILIPLFFSLAATYSIGNQMIGFDFSKASSERAMAVLRPMTKPDLIEPRRELNSMWTPIYVPCSTSEATPSARRESNGMTAFATPDCAAVLETVIVSVSGMWPNTDTVIWWETNIGDDKPLGGNENAPLIIRTDDTGSLDAAIHVPSTVLIAQPDPTLMLQHRVYFDQYHDLGGFQVSTNGAFVIKGMIESITMALMATTLGALLAIPLSFLAAHNLMSGNPVTLGIYFVIRSILNIVRSIEALIIAIVFVIIIGLGPFAGLLALTIHTVAALGKLFSEVIEGIDPGPIEAVRATGANWLQVVRYGVIPQIVPSFTAFTIYRWDINVRSSTIVGFVGGGGIGFYLVQWIQINEMRAVSAAFIAIAVVIVSLDYLSANVRERIG